MNRKIRLQQVAVLVVATVAIVACNMYESLAKPGTPEEYKEEARKCLHNGDYACAITNYEALPDGVDRDRHLCQVHIARAGFTLTALINLVPKAQQSTQVLGEIASILLPYTAEKEASATIARTVCASFKNRPESGELGVLFRVLGNIVQCATLIAKTDTLVANSDSDSSCTTAGNADGKITRADVGGSDTVGVDQGKILAGQTGMCAADATSCLTAILEVGEEAESLGAQGFGDVAKLYDQIKEKLPEGSTAQLARYGLKTLVPNN